MLTAGVLACAFVAQRADAVIIDAGVATLESATIPGDILTASYSVDLTGVIYTYTYQVFNPLTDPTKPDQFSVTFDAEPGTSVLAITSGTGIINTGSSVTWFFAPVVQGGMSGFLSFTSLDAPMKGNAGANDANPPAPWSTTNPGGTMLDVPNVPDGGMTVAFLGFALVGVEGLRRKLRK